MCGLVMHFSEIKFSVRALEQTSPNCWGSWALAELLFEVKAAGFQCGPKLFFFFFFLLHSRTKVLNC